MEEKNQEEMIAELIAGLDHQANQETGHITVMPENKAMGTHQKGLLDEDDIRMTESTKKEIERKPKRKLI